MKNREHIIENQKCKEFDIYFEDLTTEAQRRLCSAFETTPENENWNIMPIAIVVKEEMGEEIT